MARPRKKSRGILPWWLDEGTEVCSACKQTYAFHTEVRCVDCDGPMCPFCVQVTVAMEVSCPTCFEGSGSGTNQAKG